MAYTTINKPDTYFNTKLYTGNNNVTQTISGVGFQPDFTWIKCRTDAEYHHLADAVRGANKFLHSNTTDSEITGSRASGYNTMAFTSDGFSLTNPTAQNDELNFGTRNYTSWNWKANGAGVSNTQGSITSTVSANTTSGFSIVSYTGNGTSGATVGHGLGVAPAFTIVKNRSMAGRNFQGFHKSLGNTKSHLLNSTEVPRTNAVFWNNTSPTSTLITLGNDADVNESGKSFIAYCFAEVKGFSKFGSYTGNGSTDGTFVYTGFKPAWLMMKRTDTLSQWRLWDNKRNTFNVADTVLLPNDSGADTTNSSQYVDLLSNGFKWRASYVDTNASGGTFIYAAFAEQPLVGTNNVPATAK